jgi:two-component system nitrate/nitrite response regulator NarL
MGRGNSVRIVVADDCAEWRAKLRSMLEARPEWRIVGMACDGLEAVQKAAELHPDLVLLDIGMPVLNGIGAAKRIRRISPDSKIIFVTQENDSDVRIVALATGAERYLMKAKAGRELLPAIAVTLRNVRRTEQKIRHSSVPLAVPQEG